MADEYLENVSKQEPQGRNRLEHIRQTEEHFRRPVESGLDVGVNSLAFIARGSEINDLDDGTFKAAGVVR